jgi:hypothetical protein
LGGGVFSEALFGLGQLRALRAKAFALIGRQFLLQHRAQAREERLSGHQASSSFIHV